jgi:hypothetical protein
MNELLEAVKKLLAHPNKDEVVSTIQKEAPAVYQAIFQPGFDNGYGKKAGELDAVATKLKTVEGELTSTKTELTALKNAPDQQAIHKQYGDQIATLTADAKKRESELQATLNTEREARVITSLESYLTTPDKAGKRVDRDYAKVTLEKSEVRKRIKVAADGSVQILQKGKEIPFSGTADEAMKALEAELRGEAPPKFILVGSDTGGGTSSTGAATGEGSDDKAFADSIRDSVKKDTEKNVVRPAFAGAFAGLNTNDQ